MLNWFSNCRILRKNIIEIVAGTILLTILMLGLHKVICSDIITGKNAFYLAISSFILILQGKLFSEKVKYYSYLFLFLGVFCSLFAIRMILGQALPGSIFRENVGFFIGLSNTIMLILALIGKNKLRYAVYPLLLLCFLPLAIYWGYYIQAHAWLSSDSIMAIMQTNISEAREFVYSNFTILPFVVGFIVIMLLMLLMNRVASLQLIGLSKLTALCLLVVFGANIGLLAGQRKNFYTWFYWQSKKYTKAVQEFKKAKELRQKNLVAQLKNIAAGDKGVYVLVVGESQTREHMGAYGYSRPTTPWLSSMEAERNFIKFSQGYSSWSNTMKSLTYALTAKNQYNSLKQENAVSLIEAANAAGMNTVWLSNQAKLGVNDTPVGVIASAAQKQVWINKGAGINASSLDSHYDEELINEIEKLKFSDNMLLVVHLLGNHENYGLRYPKQFNKYPSTSKIDTYDNSILYNDFIMEQIYKNVTKLPNFKTMLYFADHGEGVDFGLAHDANNLKKQMLTVPVYVYLSEGYLVNKPKALTRLKSLANTPFTNDLIFNLQMSLMGVKVPDCYEAENDPLVDAYNNNSDRFRTMYGAKKLSELD